MAVRKLKKKFKRFSKSKSRNASPHQSASSLPRSSSSTNNPVTTQSSAGGTLSPLAQITRPESAPPETAPTIAQPASLPEPGPGPITISSLPSPVPKPTSTPADPTPIVADNSPQQSAGLTNPLDPGSDPYVPVSSSPPPSQPTSNRESPKSGSTIADSAWKSLTAFAGVVSKGASAFGPLKEVIDVFARFVEATDTAIAGQPGFDAVKAELGALFTDLIKLFPENSPPTMTNSMKSLCGAVRNELELISLRQGGFIRRQDEAQDLNRCAMGRLARWCSIHSKATPTRSTRLHSHLMAHELSLAHSTILHGYGKHGAHMPPDITGLPTPFTTPPPKFLTLMVG
ncbi:Vegetative incompatibility protein HET-E-1 [Ceratobasidium theobromae]|uniref:Vegetative incompatibility protein HET-E-1 n=1 Tax=Ceratobasidium theobromae TaxID=1582974 RepID=A0A5N5QBN9_9AGAM|nr:Vegetative incompatibility protein HET-E-1 [Ceratobasidium theobromae]